MLVRKICLFRVPRSFLFPWVSTSSFTRYYDPIRWLLILYTKTCDVTPFLTRWKYIESRDFLSKQVFYPFSFREGTTLSFIQKIDVPVVDSLFIFSWNSLVVGLNGVRTCPRLKDGSYFMSLGFTSLHMILNKVKKGWSCYRFSFTFWWGFCLYIRSSWRWLLFGYYFLMLSVFPCWLVLSVSHTSKLLTITRVYFMLLVFSNQYFVLTLILCLFRILVVIFLSCVVGFSSI